MTVGSSRQTLRNRSQHPSAEVWAVIDSSPTQRAETDRVLPERKSESCRSVGFMAYVR